MVLRTLGWVLDAPPPGYDVLDGDIRGGAGVGAGAGNGGLAVVALYRCFNNATLDHAVSTSSTCDGGKLGQPEFPLGYAFVEPAHRW